MADVDRWSQGLGDEPERPDDHGPPHPEGAGGTYAQDDYGRAARRSTVRTDGHGGGSGYGPTYGQDRSGRDGYGRKGPPANAGDAPSEDPHAPSGDAERGRQARQGGAEAAAGGAVDGRTDDRT